MVKTWYFVVALRQGISFESLAPIFSDVKYHVASKHMLAISEPTVFES